MAAAAVSTVVAVLLLAVFFLGYCMGWRAYEDGVRSGELPENRLRDGEN